MTKQQAEEYYRTLEKLEEVTGKPGGEVREAMEVFASVERRLSRIHERQCNGHQDWQGNWDEKAAEKDERAEARQEARATAAAEALGLKVTFNGDPRGGAVCLILPDGRSNNMSGETWGIYWV